MPTTYPDFPLANRQDARKFNEESEDVAVREKMEGGYVFTRPKFTRAARRTFRTGFTDLTNAEKEELDAFWYAMKGGTKIFAWKHPITGVSYNVRFQKSFTFRYTGVGSYYRWDVDEIALEQV